MKNAKILDCTLRDGGYYNNWDFSQEIIESYLLAMSALSIKFVEIGFRQLKNSGFQGPCAFSTESFLNRLSIPKNLNLCVMINAKEIILSKKGIQETILSLFIPAANSHISMVRVACYAEDFSNISPAIITLKELGYDVAVNFMQITNKTPQKVESLAESASSLPIDILYFADSLGNLNPEGVSTIVNSLKKYWTKEIGIHTHDNMGYGLSNCIRSLQEGVSWIDSTVTGMGRGAGNTPTEYLVIHLSNEQNINLIPLLNVIKKHFNPLKKKYGWGSNPYYYLAGKFEIHPTYIQEMLADTRYSEEDILSVIEYLKQGNGKKYTLTTLVEAAKHFYTGKTSGRWNPAEMIQNKTVLILGTGPGVIAHNKAIHNFIRKTKPFVIALNTQTAIEPELINIRAACHPARLLADCDVHCKLPQPLATPASMMPSSLKEKLNYKELLDFGLEVKENTFEFYQNHCVVPLALVIAYTLAIANSGKAQKILLAGFDGYPPDDLRNNEMEKLLEIYHHTEGSVEILAITPTKYRICQKSVYQMEA